MSKLWPHQDRRWRNIEVPRLCTPGQWFFPRHCKKIVQIHGMSVKKGFYDQRQNLKKINRHSAKQGAIMAPTCRCFSEKKERTFVFWLFDNFLLLSKFPSFQPLWLWGHFYFGTVVWKCWKIIKGIFIFLNLALIFQ